MNVREQLLDEFNRLISEVSEVVRECGFDGQELGRWPSPEDYLLFRTRALNLVRRACGKDSDHFNALRDLTEAPNSNAQPYRILEYLGILKAAHMDFERGLLFDLKALVEAEVIGDFLEQAESLFASGYYVAAASLAGAALEDGMRKLCDGHGLSYPPKTKIDSLNSELAKAGVYNKLIQKRITAIADVRNNADHGHPDKFKPDDVEDMLNWVRRFLADHLR